MYSKEATFVNLTPNSSQSVLPAIPYLISWRSSTLLLEVFTKQEDTDPSLLWLSSQLLPRLEKWALKAQVSKDSPELSIQSLSLVNKEKYNTLYQTLKKKYGQEMVKVCFQNQELKISILNQN